MAVKVAINGLDVLVLHSVRCSVQVEIVAINDATSPKMLAHLLKYDSTQGRYALADTVVAEKIPITVDGKEIKLHAKANAAELPRERSV